MEFQPRDNGNWVNIKVESSEEDSIISRRLNGVSPEGITYAYPYETGVSKARLAGLAHGAMLSVDKKEIDIARQIVDYFDAQATPSNSWLG
ncbi:hypothetical protein KW801_01380 [Candidatus Saccharibacteria bacterium]|nr:hypothetical protein [Candidatus Saccharibacteria bacterium]